MCLSCPGAVLIHHIVVHMGEIGAEAHKRLDRKAVGRIINDLYEAGHNILFLEYAVVKINGDPFKLVKKLDL